MRRRHRPPARTPRKERADVLLVYPPWVNQMGRGGLQRMLPPLGILSIAAVLEQHGLEVHVVDLQAERLGPARFREIVRTLAPRTVGITVLTPHVVPANHVAKICKEEVPDARVFVGGVHAEARPEQMLRNRHIDGVGRGDGEEMMVELAKGAPLEDVLGLSWRQGGRVVHNPARPVVMDLDERPFPAYHLVDFDNYFPSVGSYRDLPAMNVLFTRGCPGKCTFCNSAEVPLRRRSAAKIVEMIRLLRYEHGIRHIYFYDDTFTASPAVVREFCQRMIDGKVDVKWTCFVRGDMFRDEMAALMARAGCTQVLVGIESGSEEVTARIGKPMARSKYVDVVRTARRHGIETRGSFIIGNPGETEETMQATLDFAIELGLDFFQLNVMTPYPGTRLFGELKAKGQLLHEDYTRYGQSELVHRLDHLTPEDVARFDAHAYRAFYLRPSAIYRQLRRLRNFQQVRDLAKAAYVVLAEKMAERNASFCEMAAWLDVDLAAIEVPGIEDPAEERLTFELHRLPKRARSAERAATRSGTT